MESADTGIAPGRHASNLELFLDLVFVFVVTQITSFLAEDLTWAGTAKAVLLAWLAWWQWTQFTWAGSAIDFDSTNRKRVMVLCMIPAVLVMAISLPQAFSSQPIWFAASYLVVQMWVLGLQGAAAWSQAETRRSFIRYAPTAAIAPATLLLGSFFGGSTRIALWVFAGALNVLSAYLGGRSDLAWAIDPVHFAERHALFVIISLGEVLVAIGANAQVRPPEGGMDLQSLLAIVAAVAVAGVCWWSYFAYIPRVFEHFLAHPGNRSSGRIARDLGSFGHFPIICGVIAYAVVAKHLVQHPSGPLAVTDRGLLVGFAVLFIGGFLFIQWLVSRTLAPQRWIAIVVVALVASAAGALPGIAIVASISLTLGTAALLTWRHFRHSDIARLVILES